MCACVSSAPHLPPLDLRTLSNVPSAGQKSTFAHSELCCSSRPRNCSTLQLQTSHLEGLVPQDFRSGSTVSKARHRVLDTVSLIGNGDHSIVCCTEPRPTGYRVSQRTTVARESNKSYLWS